MRLYLGIPPASGINWGSFPWYALRNYLLTWLRSCCSAHSDTSVFTIGTHHDMGPMDGLVYLVGDQSNSVVWRLGAPESGNLDAGETSSLNGEMLSEVYVNPSTDAYPMAANVYHELLHNKFRLSVNIHNTPGGNFTNAMAPYDSNGPTWADQQLMCAALSENARQCQAGFDLPDGG